MFKSKKPQREKRRRRTSLEIEDEQSRTLYIRVPHTIKDVGEIKSLFFGTFKVRLPRQSGRYCHVLFSSLEEKVKNMKAIKKKVIDGKPIYAGPPKPLNLEKKKKPTKKIKIPEPVEEVPTFLYVAKIPIDAKVSQIKEAFPGSTTIVLFKKSKNKKEIKSMYNEAKVKMPSYESCLYYIKNKSNHPIIQGKKVSVSLAKKKNNNNKNKKIKKSHNEDRDLNNVSEPLKDSQNENKIVNDNNENNVESEDNVLNICVSDEDELDTESDEDEEDDEEDDEEEDEEEDEQVQDLNEEKEISNEHKENSTEHKENSNEHKENSNEAE